MLVFACFRKELSTFHFERKSMFQINASTYRNAVPKLLLLAGLLALQGCSQEIDARQARVDQGLIYKQGASDPFSGTLTNVGPAEIGKEYGSKLLPPVGSCTVPVKNGLIDGTVTCKGGDGKKTAEVEYSQGHQDGKFKAWSATSGVLTASATVRMGVVDGVLELFNPDTGKLITHLEIKAGKKEGKEQQWDFTGEALLTDLNWSNGKQTGVFRSGGTEEHYKNGSLDGIKKECGFLAEAGQSARQGEYARKAFEQGGTYFIPQLADNPNQVQCREFNYADGVEQFAPTVVTVSSSTQDACVDAKIAAFHKENGDDALIVSDMLQEWKASCKK
jgi:antitoxin component YwqK of YwqJK toxin-antitoxin module